MQDQIDNSKTQVFGIAAGEMDIKKLYIPGVKIKGTCEHCGKPVVYNLSKEYILNPDFGPNSSNTEYFYCEHCDENTEIKIRLELNISIIDK